MGTAYKRYSPKVAAVLTVLAMVLALFPIAAFAAGFPDVSGVLAQEINAAADAGLVSGYDDGTFRPNQNVTRAQFAKMIVLAVEKATGKILEMGDEPFSDVTPNQALYEYVVKAYKAGYIKGYGDGTFGYDKDINRQEAAAILQRALNLPAAQESFEDVPDDSDFADEIGAVAAAGIMKGYDAKNFGPGDKLTRGQAAAVAYRGYNYRRPFEVASITGLNSKQIEIRFTKPVDEDTVIDSDKTLSDAFEFKALGDAEEVTADDAFAALNSDGTVLTVTASGAEFFNGQYAVTITADVKSSDGVKLKAYSGVHTFTDGTRPSVVNVSATPDGKVKVTFSEPIEITADNAADAFDLIVDGSSANFSVSGPSDEDYWTTVTLTVNSIDEDKTYTLSVNGYVQDYTGNLISPNPTTIDFKFAEDSTKPQVKDIVALDLNTLQITFSEAIKPDTVSGSIDDGILSFTDSNDGQWDDTKTVLTIELGTDKPGLHKVTVNANYEDLAGNKGEAFSKFVTFAADETAPKVKSVSVTTLKADGQRYIIVTFDEKLGVVTQKEIAGELVADGVLYDVKIPGQNVSAHDPDSDGAFDSIKIRTTGLTKPRTQTDWTGIAAEELRAGEYKLTLPADLVSDAADDPNGNSAATITVTLGKVGETDTQAPEVESVSVSTANNDEIVVTFSEPVTNATALNTANYTVEDQTVFTAAVFLDSQKTQVRLTLKEGAIKQSGPKVLKIRNVRDSAGNVMEPYSTNVDLTENVRPTLASAKLISLNTIELKFSEPVEATDGTLKVKVSVNGAQATELDATPQNATNGFATTWHVTLSQNLTSLNDVVDGSISAGDYADANGNLGKAATFSVKPSN